MAAQKREFILEPLARVDTSASAEQTKDRASHGQEASRTGFEVEKRLH